MTIREAIIYELGKVDDWMFGGKLERYIADEYFAKPSNVSRRLREIENDGFIERRLVLNPNGGNHVTQYRIKSKEPITLKLI